MILISIQLLSNEFIRNIPKNQENNSGHSHGPDLRDFSPFWEEVHPKPKLKQSPETSIPERHENLGRVANDFFWFLISTNYWKLQETSAHFIV